MLALVIRPDGTVNLTTELPAVPALQAPWLLAALGAERTTWVPLSPRADMWLGAPERGLLNGVATALAQVGRNVFGTVVITGPSASGSLGLSYATARDLNNLAVSLGDVPPARFIIARA